MILSDKIPETGAYEIVKPTTSIMDDTYEYVIEYMSYW